MMFIYKGKKLQLFWATVDSAKPSTVIGFGMPAAMSSASLGLAISWLLRVGTGVELPFLFCTGAVIFNSVRRGAVAALCATFVSLIGTIIIGGGDVHIVNTRSLAAFFSLCVIIAISGEVLQRRRIREQSSFVGSSQREHILQVMFRDSPAATLIVDSLGWVLAANGAAARLFGHIDGTITGRQLHELVLECGEEKALSTETALPYSRLRHFSFSETPLLIAGRNFRMIYVRDNTDALIAAERLTTTQRELYQIARATALGQLGSSIAHELNQPLAFVTNYAGVARALLSSDTLNIQAIREAVDDTLTQAFRAAGVLKRLRNFVGRKPPKLLPVNARDALEDAARLGSLAAKDARAELDTDFTAIDLAISVDVIQLQQIVLNLLMNAADAVRDCTDRRIRLHGWRYAANELRFAVEDSGLGIPAHLRADIFKPFKSTKTDGVGIGLAICRTIIEAHGGRIWCDDDTVLGGARFVFALPLFQHLEQSHAA